MFDYRIYIVLCLTHSEPQIAIHRSHSLTVYIIHVAFKLPSIAFDNLESLMNKCINGRLSLTAEGLLVQTIVFKKS